MLLAAWLAAKSVSWLAAGLLAAWLVPDRLYRPTLPLLWGVLFRFLTLSRCIRVEFPELRAPLSRLNTVDSQAIARLRK